MYFVSKVGAEISIWNYGGRESRDNKESQFSILNELNRIGANYMIIKAEDHGAIIEMDSKHKNKDHYIILHCTNPQWTDFILWWAK